MAISVTSAECIRCRHELYAPAQVRLSITPRSSNAKRSIQPNPAPPSAPTHNLTDLLTDSLKLKLACRSGITKEQRTDVWLISIKQHCGGNTVLSRYESEYKQMSLQMLNGHDLSIFQILPHDSIPTFAATPAQDWIEWITSNDLLSDSAQLLQFKILLCTLSYAQPTVTYIPPLIHLLLCFLHYYHHTQQPSLIYSMLTTIITRSKRDNFYLPMSTDSYVRLAAVISSLVNDKYPQTYKHLQTLSFDLTSLFHVWLETMFTTLIPTYVQIHRLLDCFLCEGRKVLVRVALAIIQQNKAAIKRCGSRQEVLARLYTQSYDMDELLKVGFDISLSRSQIDKIFDQVQPTTTIHAPSMSFHLPRRVTSDILDPLSLITLWKFLPALQRQFDPVCLYSTSIHGYSYESLIHRCSRGDDTTRNKSSNHPLIVLVRDSESRTYGFYVDHLLPPTPSTTPIALSASTFLFTLSPLPQHYKHQRAHDTAQTNVASQLCERHQTELTDVEHQQQLLTLAATVPPEIAPPAVHRLVDSDADDSEQRVATLRRSISLNQDDCFMLLYSDVFAICTHDGTAVAIDSELKTCYSQASTAFNNQPLMATSSTPSSSVTKLQSAKIVAIECWSVTHTLARH